MYYTVLNYLLDCPRYEISKKDMNYIYAVITMIENDWSLRYTEKNTEIPKSTLHNYIHGRLRKHSSELYILATRQMRINYAEKIGRKGNDKL